LAEKDVTCNDTPTSSDPVTDTSKIRTAASFWHADVIRFQVAEQNLLPNGSVDQAFLAHLKADVRLANSLCMVAIVTD
jgi:Zn-dependent M28 family amino/carboxypeptidase